MHRLLLLGLLLVGLAACGTSDTARPEVSTRTEVAVPSAVITPRSPSATPRPPDHSAVQTQVVVSSGDITSRISSATPQPLDGSVPLKEPIYVIMPTYIPRPTVVLSPRVKRPWLETGSGRSAHASAQDVITALQTAGLTVNITEAPNNNALDGKGKDVGFEYASLDVLSGGERYQVGITICPSKQACEEAYELWNTVALHGHVQLWRSPDGLILCMAVPPAPDIIADTIQRIIQGP